MIKQQATLSLELQEKMDFYQKQGYKVPTLDMIKTPEEIEKIKASGVINTAVLDHVEKHIKAGMTTQDIDDLVSSFTKKHQAICAPLNFEGYPKSVCTSVNHEVCHGIPSKLRKLKEGDIVNVDVSTIYNGYYSDASRMFIVGKTSKEREKLIEVTKECLALGLKQCKPYNFTGDIGHAIQSHAEKHGYSVVRELGGHGVGIEFHEDPFIYHFGKPKTGLLLVPGMVFTVEPMINAGGKDVVIDRYNGWTIYTKDGKDSAQVEHTVLITETGYEILTY